MRLTDSSAGVLANTQHETCAAVVVPACSSLLAPAPVMHSSCSMLIALDIVPMDQYYGIFEDPLIVPPNTVLLVLGQHNQPPGAYGAPPPAAGAYGALLVDDIMPSFGDKPTIVARSSHASSIMHPMHPICSPMGPVHAVLPQ